MLDYKDIITKHYAINVTLDGCATTADSISGTGNPEVTLRG